MSHDKYNKYDDSEENFGPSKSQIKREMHALRDLGAELIKLSDNDLAKIPLPDTLADALAEARRLKSHGALKRQQQYIGKIIRDVDPEPIRIALDALKQASDESSARFHQLERWREQLLGENGQDALTQFITQYPEADRQRLRQLMSNAVKELAKKQAPKSSRTLFKLLRETVETHDEQG